MYSSAHGVQVEDRVPSVNWTPTERYRSCEGLAPRAHRRGRRAGRRLANRDPATRQVKERPTSFRESPATVQGRHHPWPRRDLTVGHLAEVLGWLEEPDRAQLLAGMFREGLRRAMFRLRTTPLPLTTPDAGTLIP